MAMRYLWLLEGNSPAVMLGLGGIQPAGMPVVLYNGTVNSNGMVVWAPKRMELYTMPVRSSYPQRWDVQLALHESRHVGQMTHFTKGVYRPLSYLLGQQSPSIGVGLYASRWFLEGDAVVAETELSNTGRGRTAEFMEYYRASFLEGKFRNWDRWKQGSYRHYTPNAYTLGYLINSTARYKSGKYGISGDILSQTVRQFYNPNIRDRSYRDVVGSTPKELLEQGQQMMTSIWKEELLRRGKITDGDYVLEKRGRGYQEYSAPMEVGKDSVLYIKSSYNNPTRLVLAVSGKEQVLRSFSASANGFEVFGDTMWFTESVTSSRWSNEAYGRLYAWNWRSSLGGGQGDGKVRNLSGRSWFKGPDISADGKTLLVGEYFPAGGSAVTLLNPATGEVRNRIALPYDAELVEAIFWNDDIVALAVTDNGLGVFKWSCGGWSTIIEEQSAVISRLQLASVPACMFGAGGGDAAAAADMVDVLYFVSDVDGVRNVYMLEPVSGKLRRLTNSLYGATEPYIGKHGIMYYSSLELDGRFPVKVPLEKIDSFGSGFDPYMDGNRMCSRYRYVVADELSAQAGKAMAEAGISVVENDSAAEAEFAANVKPRRYSKLGKLFHFHSWAPLYYNVDRIMDFDFDNLYQVVGAGATAYSQNTLGTAVSMLGYSYHKGFHAGHFKFKYTGWMPAFQISADVNADERYMIKVVRDDSGTKREVTAAAGPLVELDALAYIPLRFNSHGWQRGITPQISWSYSNDGYYDTSRESYLNVSTVTSALQFYVMRDMARSAIYPEWGIGGTAKWGFAVNGGENFGNVASVHLYGYLPGIAATHGIKLSASVQRQNVDGKNYWLGNMVGMPRGYSKSFYSRNYYKGAVDYAFPVYLGDIGLWEIAYVKRLQVIPFADYAIGKSMTADGKTVPDARLYSIGTDFLVDCAPFKFGVECSIGVRYSFNGNNAGLPGKGSAFQFLFSTALP